MSEIYYCDTVQTIKEAINFGFKPIILGEHSKIPIEIQWQDKYKNITPDSLLKESERRRGSNIGIYTGKLSNIICIDVDIQNNGMDKWCDILSKNGVDDIDSLETPIVMTGSRGRHYYFKYDDSLDSLQSYLVNENKKKITGIDIKISGQIVYPGSIYGGCGKAPHKCGNDIECKFRGNPYEWIKSPNDVSISYLPSWIKKYLRKKPKKIDINNIAHSELIRHNSPIKNEENNGKINNDKIHNVISILKERAESYDQWRDMIWCIKGLGYNLDIAHQFSKQSKKYNSSSVEDIWERFDNDKVTWNWGTIRNWLKEDLNEDEYKKFIFEHFPNLSKEDICLQGDWGLAHLFVEQVKHKLKITDDKGNGYIFDEKLKLWKKLPFSFLNNIVSDVLKPIIEGFIKNTEYESKEKTEERKKLLIAPLKSVLSYQGSNVIAKKSIKDLYDNKFIERLNKKEMLLPISNGKVIELNSLKIRERLIDDLFSFECPVNFIRNDKDEYPIAEEFFRGICCNDPDYINYMRNFCSYCFSGSISDRSFYILTGSGLNGKSSLMTIMNKIMGDFYTPLSEDVMISFDRKGGATPEIVPLLYSRLGVLPESKEEVILNCERVKRLTGSDTMTCRALYKDEISFETQSKIVLMTNNLPKFNGFDKAMTDRIKIIPFKAIFQNNPSYMDKLKLNIDEIFTYIVIAGIEFWTNKNLGKIPKIMEDATFQYFKDNDSFSLFIEEECEIGEAGYDEKIYKIQGSTAYDYYISFCERNSYKKVTKQIFGQLMEKRFDKKRSKNSVFYIGLKINNILE